MTDENRSRKATAALIDWLVAVGLNVPWLEVLAEVWKLVRKLWRGLADEGMYEVLEYESTLELKDERGKVAHHQKRERVRFVQNNIIAFQDQAWGDGRILLNYQCAPGVEVDRYRPGHKTFILISLREEKSRGDIDEFNIEWGIRNGFLRSTEAWETEISHRMKFVKVKVIFPKTRPPLRVWLIEQLRRRTQSLGESAKVQLPDGRWLISWETHQPRFHERYMLKWEW